MKVLLVLLVLCYRSVYSTSSDAYFINKFKQSILARSAKIVIYPLQLSEQIGNYEKGTHTVELDAMMNLKWVDKLLQNSLKNFESLQRLLDDSKHFSDNYSSAITLKRKLTLEEGGLLSLKNLVKVISICDFNYKYFPFDRQICVIRFQSSSPSQQNQIPFELLPQSTVDFNYLASNPKWDLESIQLFAKTESELTFRITMTRKYLKYVLNIFLPSVFFTFILLVALKMPARSKQKILLLLIVMSIFYACNYIFRHSMNEMKHKNSLLGLFLHLMVVDTFLALISALVINLLSRECVFFRLPERLKTYFIASLLAEHQNHRTRNYLETTNKNVAIKLISSFLTAEKPALNEDQSRRVLLLSLMAQFLNAIIVMVFTVLFSLTFLALLVIIPTYAWLTHQV